MRRFFAKFVILMMMLGVGTAAAAQEGLVVASMSGEQSQSFTIEDLRALTQVVVRTSNEFVEQESEFTGPLARDVLSAVGPQASGTLLLTAANDYQVEVPATEIYDYDVIFALEMDGVALSRRDKGPIWVIYPMTQHKELQDPVYNSRLIWQLVRVEYE